MRELFDNVNKGGFKERFHSKLYRNIVLYLVQSESYVKVYTGQFIMYSGITKIYYRKTIGHILQNLYR